ncbi:unnamed protein product [Oppiella nova]|uniref:Uncharacterized protein n=1 Tax=Oppiella nova TaxID=334625 RepID=A0A7R9QIV6_9ACAR|nr:unnamed protein product [Oppiella nova]CAG2166627.1 unnamed protein product [Oppiella nova]
MVNLLYDLRYAMVGPEKKAVPVPENVLQLAQEDRLGTLKVAELQAFCESKGIIPAASRKAEYILAIRKFCNL